MELEGLRTSRFGGLYVVKKKRSSTLRRPWSEINRYVREFKYPDGGHNKQASNYSDVKFCNEGVIALFAPTNNCANYTEKSSLDKQPRSHDVSGGKICNKAIKLKFKLGGATRTINEKSYRIGNNSSMESLQSSHPSQDQHRRITQKNAVENFFSQAKSNGLQRDSMNGINGSNFLYEAKEYSLGKENIKSEAATYRSVSKGKTLATRWMSDTPLTDSDEDDEIRFLGKLRASKAATGCTPKDQNKKKDNIESQEICGGFRRSSAHMDNYYILPSGWTTKQRKNSRSENEPSDADYVAEEENGSISASGLKKKKFKKSVEFSTEGRLEPHITRQRALQSTNGATASSLIEFPDGLPLVPSKRMLSEEEIRAKKVEAAQRRKIQSERAARESEAKTIRKIRGLDSEKTKAEKERERAHKAKAAIAAALSSNTVRLVMGPNGTVVTFPKDVPLPSIFDPKPCSYPPPREKCAGPSCTNSYKYRDSRSNLPLCSLLCYRAVQGSARSVNSPITF